MKELFFNYSILMVPFAVWGCVRVSNLGVMRRGKIGRIKRGKERGWEGKKKGFLASFIG